MSVIAEPQSASLLEALNPLAMLRRLWGHRELIRQLTAREVAQRYRGSYLGLLWSLLTPALLLAMYTFVFSVILKARWDAGRASDSVGGYALTLFAGLIPFNVFAEVVNRAPHLILSVTNYVKKVVFPLEILPIVALGSAVVHSLIGFGILLIAHLIVLGAPPLTALWLPLAYAPLILLSLGLAWFLASLGVYVRDIGQGIGLMVQILLFLSPILYPLSRIPESLRPAFNLNPMATIVEGFRRVLLWGQGLPWAGWGVWTAATAVLALLGYGWFMKTKKGFADVM
jgi:lipopolysaccharide transport system permease protein